MTEFVENVACQKPESRTVKGVLEADGKAEKKEFPRLRVCLSADSLYACEGFFEKCSRNNWHYILRFKEGSIPTIGEEYRSLQKILQNGWEETCKGVTCRYDYVTDIDYKGNSMNLAAYEEIRETKIKKGKRKGITKQERKEFWFITNLPFRRKNLADTIERGMMRWKIENEGFNTQKLPIRCTGGRKR